jgi:serine/threonine-protein kinase RsbT
MKLRDIQRLLQADLVSGPEECLETEIDSGCGSDLMSDVLAFGHPGQVLLTGLTNAQSVRTADIIETKAIVYVRNKRPDESVLELARLKNIPLLATRHMMFEACGILFQHGLPAAGHVDQVETQVDINGTNGFSHAFEIVGGNFGRAGNVSTAAKELLKELGVDSGIIRRAAIAAYEAEMNIVMYAERGELTLLVTPDLISIRLRDKGPGIPDIELAMQEGYSTATQEMREMGFGAGMGLPNIQKNADRFKITSEVGKGTSLEIYFDLRSQKRGEA